MLFRSASIPIIIHLLNRNRFRVVTWAAMRFLLAAQRKNTRRMRLEQLILLAVRVLMVVLLVLAMASVYGWANGPGDRSSQQPDGRSVSRFHGSLSQGAKRYWL